MLGGLRSSKMSTMTESGSEHSTVEMPRIDFDAPRNARRRKFQFGLGAFFVFVTLTSLLLAWYVNTPGPPRMDMSSTQGFHNSVLAIRADLWEANEQKFVRSLSRYWWFSQSPGMTAWGYCLPSDESGLGHSNSSVGLDFFRPDIEELNGMTGPEVIEFVDRKFGSSPPSNTNGTSTPRTP